MLQAVAIDATVCGARETTTTCTERDFLIDKLLVRIRCIIVMIGWAGLTRQRDYHHLRAEQI